MPTSAPPSKKQRTSETSKNKKSASGEPVERENTQLCTEVAVLPQQCNEASQTQHRKQQQHTRAVTEDDFQGYTTFKILEAIGQPGAYRRFMHTRREQRQPWAIHMSACIQAVANAIKELAVREQELKTSPKLYTLYPIWQYVADSSLPPSDLPMSIDTCAISGKTNVLCVHIRCKGRGAQQFTVCNRFVPFFSKLWTINKMDVLLKVYTRMCVEQFDPEGKRALAETVAYLESKTHETQALARAFYSSYMHVYLSVRQGLADVV